MFTCTKNIHKMHYLYYKTVKENILCMLKGYVIYGKPVRF